MRNVTLKSGKSGGGRYVFVRRIERDTMYVGFLLQLQYLHVYNASIIFTHTCLDAKYVCVQPIPNSYVNVTGLCL